MFSETKITEIYCMTDDFCKEIAQFQEKYMVEDKDIEYSAVNGQFAHFPIVFHFRYIGIREVHGIAYLSVGAMQRYNANFLTAIRLWRTVFLPIKTACNYIAAEQF